jgi:hypothetical protein
VLGATLGNGAARTRASAAAARALCLSQARAERSLLRRRDLGWLKGMLDPSVVGLLCVRAWRARGRWREGTAFPPSGGSFGGLGGPLWAIGAERGEFCVKTSLLSVSVGLWGLGNKGKGGRFCCLVLFGGRRGRQLRALSLEVARRSIRTNRRTRTSALSLVYQHARAIPFCPRFTPSSPDRQPKTFDFRRDDDAPAL